MRKEPTLEHFRALFPHCPLSIAHEQLPLLNATLRQYQINNKLRIAAFCATLAQESGEFRYREELADGWDYEGRSDLGNCRRGDGPAMKGHGRIQITGRENHTLYAQYVRKSGHVPFVDFSDQKLAKRICDDPYALDASGWFWTVLKRLNPAADRSDFLYTQTRVNGRNKKTHLPNHWKERTDYYQRALRLLPDDIGFDDEPGPIIDVHPAAVESPHKIATPLEPASPAPSDDDSLLNTGVLNSAMASDGAKQAGKKVLIKAAMRLSRPVALLVTALEAGNVFAWLGVGVAVVGLGVLIYVERDDIARGARWLVGKLKKSKVA